MKNKLVVCDENAPTCTSGYYWRATAQCEDLSGEAGLDLTPCSACDSDSEVCYVAPDAGEAECKGFDAMELWAECFQHDGAEGMEPQCEQQCRGFGGRKGPAGCTEDLCSGMCDDDSACLISDDVIECAKIDWFPAECNPRNISVSTCKEGEACGEGNVCFTPILPAK